MPHSIRPGDVLADRYLLVDLLSESDGGRFFRAEDRVLDRHVALHVITDTDDRAAGLMEAARVSATIADRRILRVLDADQRDGLSYVVNEYGDGTSLDHLVAGEGPLPPRRAAWLVAEVADTLRTAHEARVAHGRLVPENVLVDESGQVRIIGFCVDAALSGLPSGGISEDVANLGGLLYFLLTGRWAGPGSSACPPAPTDHGRVLRARQVRAGIPRALDALCDQVLNPYAASPIDTGHNPHTAQGIRDLLLEFVGDPGGWGQPAGPGALAIPLRRPASPDPEPDPEPESEPEPGSEPEPAPRPDPHAEPGQTAPEATAGTGTGTRTGTAPDTPADPDLAAGPLPPPAVGGGEPTQVVSPADQATQLGMPIFDDEGDDVTWLTARSQPPAPPPPLEEPPERPLFAAQSSRTPRAGSTAAAKSEYWPWESTGAATTGSGVIPVTEDDDSDGDSRLPGGSWLRLAALVLAGLVLLVAVVIAYNLGRGKTPLGADPSGPASSPPTTATASHQPIEGVTASDLDPQADPPEENPAEARLAVDGDPSTAWSTSTYTDQLGPPPGLKTGVGLVLDLHGSHDVTGIDLTLVGQPTTVKVFAADRLPTRVAGLTTVDTFTAARPRVRRTFDQAASARYLVVWLTALPAVDGGYRGEVAEAVPTE